MFLLRIGVLPPARVAGRASACLALALALAGCSGKATETAEVWPWSTPPAKVAAAVPPPKPDLEEDGMEAQVAPPRAIREAPDDPSEPWSRNYGPPAATRRADVPQDLPPDFRRRLVASVPD